MRDPALSPARPAADAPAAGFDRGSSVDGLTRRLPTSDRDNPVMPQVERQLVVQPIDERRAVLVQERDEADRPFLRVAVGEGERARAR